MTTMTTEMDGVIPAYKKDTVLAAALLMCVLGAVFYCYEYYFRVAPSVIHPELMQTFALSQAGIGTLIAYYYLAYVPLQIPVGLMMDFWGPRRVLTLACLICAGGTYLFASTDVVWVAKLGRFLVGFGSAFAYVGVLKIANLWLPGRYFAMVAGFCTALGMFGAMSGSILMAKFIEMTGWQQALYISSLVGVVLSFVLWIVIRDKSDREFINRSRSSHKGLSVWTELLEVVKNKQLWVNGIIGCLTFLPLTAFAECWSVEYLKKVGLTKDAAAFGSSLVFFGYAVGGPVWGWLSDLIKSRRKPLMFGSIASAIIALIMLNMQANNIAALYTTLFLMGFLASVQILVFAVGEDNCRPGMSATTVSFTNFLVMLGGYVVPPVVGFCLDASQTLSSNGDPILSIHSFKIAMIILPIGLLLGSILSFFLKESYNLKS